MKLFESKQKPLVVYNPADVLYKYHMKPGDFVSIAYISDVLHGGSSTPISRSGRKDMYNINYETDEQLESFINELPENNFKRLLIEFRNSKKYQELLANGDNGKRARIDLSSEHIIKVSHLTCNWKDAKGLAKFYEKQRNSELQLRKDYGFDDGFEDPTDITKDDENWRDKYNGRNILPRINSKMGNPKNEPTVIPGIYASLSEPSNVLLRFAYNAKASTKDAEYYYVNGDGTLLPMTKAFMSFLMFAYLKNSNKENTEDETISPEEKEFLMKLKAILNEAPSTAEVSLSCDKILFLKSTARSSNRSKEADKIPFVWINSNNILNTYDFIKPEELNKIIKQYVYSINDSDINGTIENINVKGKSIVDLVNTDGSVSPSDVRARLNLTESLSSLALLYYLSKYNKRLYESIMKTISKEVKKALNS